MHSINRRDVIANDATGAVMSEAKQDPWRAIADMEMDVHAVRHFGMIVANTAESELEIEREHLAFIGGEIREIGARLEKAFEAALSTAAKARGAKA